MTNELEKKFFDTFGIEPKTIIEPRYSLNTEYYEKKVAYYPQITDSILLELICKLSGVCCPQFAFERGVEELKWNILKRCIHYNKELKHQVRRLFEEE